MPVAETAHEGRTTGGITIRSGTAGEAVQRFGPLKAILQAIINYADCEVCFQSPVRGSPLC